MTPINKGDRRIFGNLDCVANISKIGMKFSSYSYRFSDCP